MKVELGERYIPTGHSQFWCSYCDNHVVDSHLMDSGCFFLMGGHTYSQRTKGYDGNYNIVMFAICKHCLEL